MLEKIRKIAHHTLFKLIFLGLAIVLVLSLGEIGGSQQNTVVNIGNKNISLQEFMKTKQTLVDQAGTQQIPQEQLNNMTLNKLITQNLLQQESENLGIKISPETLAENIQSDSNFHKDGVFNLEVYKRLLEQNNLSEKMLLKILSDQVSSNLLMQSIYINLPLKNLLHDYTYEYVTEKRNIDLITVDTNKQTFMTFAANDLKDYYIKHPELFQEKEKRSFSYIKLSLDEFKKNATATDQELQKEYEENMSEYTLPETRDFYHFVAPNEKLAQEVITVLNKNDKHLEVAKLFVAQKVIGENFINQPSTSFIATIDPTLFNLNENNVTNAIKSDLGWHVFKVIKIHPKEHESLTHAKTKLDTKIRQQKAQQQIYELSRQLEDDIASGADFQDIAKRHNLSFVQANKTSGNDPITILAFKTNLNEESPLTEIKKSPLTKDEEIEDYVIVHVNEIILSKTEDYEVVLANKKIQDLYTLQQKITLSEEVAISLQEHYQKLIKNSKLNDLLVKELLKPFYYKYKTSSNQAIEVSLLNKEVIRPMLFQNDNLSVDFVNDIFALKMSKASNVKMQNTAKASFAIVNRAIFDKHKNPQIYNYLASITDTNYKNDIHDQYISYLHSKYSVKINYALITDN